MYVHTYANPWQLLGSQGFGGSSASVGCCVAASEAPVSAVDAQPPPGLSPPSAGSAGSEAALAASGSSVTGHCCQRLAILGGLGGDGRLAIYAMEIW